MLKLLSNTTFFLVFSATVNFANATPIKITKLAIPTGLKMSDVSPYSIQWNAVQGATSYRLVITQDKEYKGFTESNGKSKCDKNCVTVKIPSTPVGRSRNSDGEIITSFDGTISYTPSRSVYSKSGDYPKVGVNYIAIRAGASLIKASDWIAIAYTYKTPATNKIKPNDPLTLNIRRNFEPLVKHVAKKTGGKISEDAVVFLISGLLNRFSVAIPEIVPYVTSDVMYKVNKQILESSWVTSGLTKQLSPFDFFSFFTDVLVDALADVVRQKAPNQSKGQALAWFIKFVYLSHKSVIITGISGPLAGTAEYISGMVQLNVDIWEKVGESYFEYVDSMVKANKSEALADIADQREKAIVLYATGDNYQKENTLKLLTEVFDSIRPGSGNASLYPFPENELNEIEKNTKEIVVAFNEIKYELYNRLLVFDLNRAETFLNKYFSEAEKSIIRTGTTTF